MKRRYLITLLPILYFIPSHSVYAALSCAGNTTSALHPAQNRQVSVQLPDNVTSSGYEFTYSDTVGGLPSSTLIQCTGATGTAYSKISTFNAFTNSNIVNSVASGKAGFYQVAKTSSKFINDNVYVSFDYSDNSDTATYYPLSNTTAQIQNTSNLSYTQGIRIRNLKFYFTKTPVSDVINIPIVLGTVTGIWKETSTSAAVTFSQIIQINLSVKAASTKTCSLNSPTVTLPTLSIKTFKNLGDEAGQTQFTLTATCSAALASTDLNGFLVDNNAATSTSNLLKNMGTAQNIAIKLYHSADNTPVTLSSDFYFGKTDSSTAPKVSKNFYAKYYATAAGVTAGTVTSNATISVTYK